MMWRNIKMYRAMGVGMASVLFLMAGTGVVSAVSPTPAKWWGLNTTFDGQLVTTADIITAKDPDGIWCGTQYAWGDPGQYGIRVVGDDPDSPGDEGATSGDTLTFFINGYKAVVTSGSPVWQPGGSGQLELYAVPVPPVSATIPDTSAASGATVWVPVNLSDVTGLKIYGAHIRLTFAPEMLEADTVSLGILGQEQAWIIISRAEAGLIEIAMAGSNTLVGTGPLVHVGFHVVGSLGDTTTVKVADVLLNEGEPAAVGGGGLLSVGPPVLVSIAVVPDGSEVDPAPRDSIVIYEGTYENPATPGTQRFRAIGTYTNWDSTATITDQVSWVSSVDTVAVMDGMVATAVHPGKTEITASLGELSSPAVMLRVVPLGDLNNSGAPDVGDAVRAVNIILERSPEPTFFERFAADRHLDFHINILDVVRIVIDIIGRPFGPPAPMAKVAGGAEVTAWGGSIGEDGRITIPVAVSTSEPIFAAQLRLRYNPMALAPVAVQRTARSQGMIVDDHQAESDLWTVVLYSLTGVSMPAASEALLDLVFKATEAHRADTEVIFEEILLVDGAGDVLPLTTTEVKAEVAYFSPPKMYHLSQNTPNPFNLQTVISYAVPEGGEVVVEVFSLTGQRVRRLAEGYRAAERYATVWDGRDDQGREVGSGVYVYLLESGRHTEVRRMVLVK